MTVLLFLFLSASPAQATWLDSNWTKRVKLTIDADKVNGDLANFPVFVDLNGMPASFFTTIKDNGADLRVTKTDGSSEVPFELVYLDTSNGAGELHFQANGTLSGTSNSDWYLYYGYNGATAYARGNTYGSENVWTQGYVAVYHMNEDPNGDVADAIKDSTSNVNHGTPNGTMTSDDLALGRVGKAIDFDGGDDHVLIDDDDIFSFTNGVNNFPFTLQAWTYIRNTGGNAPTAPIVSKYESHSPSFIGEWNLGVNSDYKLFHQNLDGHSTKRVRMDSVSALSQNKWNSIVSTYNGTAIDESLVLYKNGSLLASVGFGQDSSYLLMDNHVGRVSIGSSLFNGSLAYSGFMNGIIDEVRISNTVRSAEWIWTEYQNQNSPDTFYTVGSEEENTIPVTNGLVAWWDASDLSTITSDANGVSAWADKSGNNHDASQSDNSEKPISGAETYNSLNLINFTSDYMEVANDPITIGDIFQVIKTPSNDFAGYGVPLGGEGNRMYLFQPSSNYFHSNRYPSEVWKNAAKISSSPYNLGTMHKDLFSLLVVPDDGVDTQGVEIGRIEEAFKGDFDLAELIVFDHILSESERFQIFEYLHEKWNLAGPEIISSTPNDDDTDVSVDSNISINFNQNIDIVGGNLTILKASNGVVFETISLNSISVTGNGTSILTINPSVDFDYDTSYFINIDAGALSSVNGSIVNSAYSYNGELNFKTIENIDDGFELDDLNGLELWLDASDSSTVIDSANYVIEWKDKSSNSNHALQGGVSNKPITNTETVNSLNIINFTSDYMDFTNDHITVGDTFAVMKSPSVNFSNYGTFLGGKFKRKHLFQSGAKTFHNNQYPSLVWKDNVALSSPFSLDPINEGLFSVLVLPNVGVSTDYYELGRSDSTYSNNFDLAELIVYDHELSNDQRYKVLNYLHNKWNIDAPFPSSGWSNSTKITIKSSMVNGDLSNFPVYLDLSDLPDNFFSTVDGTGADIRVTQGDTSYREIAFELVSIDTVNGTGELWFKAPYLSSTSDSDFYVWYGNNGATAYSPSDPYGSENVWTQGFVAVYHLGENGNTSAGGYKDSTAYGNDGTGVSMTSASDVTGKLGKAQNFDGSSDYINLNDDSDLEFGTNDFNISAWFSTTYNAFQYILGKGGDTSAPGYGIATNASGSVYGFIEDSSRLVFNNQGSGYNDGNLHLFSANYDRDSSWTPYLDGGILTGQNITSYQGSINSSAEVYIGRYIGGGYFDGLVDEVRVSNETRSADWIKTEFNNQNGAESFYLIDDQVPGTETSKPMFMMGGY